MSNEDEFEQIRQQLTQLQEENRTLKEKKQVIDFNHFHFLTVNFWKLGRTSLNIIMDLLLKRLLAFTIFLHHVISLLSIQKQLECLKTLVSISYYLLCLLSWDRTLILHIFPLDLVCLNMTIAPFYQMIHFVYFRFESVNTWPKWDVIIYNMPDKFKKDFPNTCVIIDEIKIQSPSSLNNEPRTK